MTFAYFILIIFLSLIIKKKWVIPFILVHEFLLVGLSTWGIVPGFMFHGYDVLIISLFFRFVNFRSIVKDNILKITILIVLFSVISIYIFSTSLEAYIMGFRILIVPLLLVNVFVNINISVLNYIKLFRLLILIGIIQVIISFGQYVYFGGAGDWAGGSLGAGGTNQLMLFQVMIIILILDKSLSANKFNIKNIFLIILLCIPILVGSSKLGLLLVPIIILIFFLKYQFKSGFNIKIIGSVGLLAILALYLFQSLVSERDLQILSDKDEFDTYNNAGIIDDGRAMSRGSILPLTLVFIDRNDAFVTGVGLGNLYNSESVSGNKINSLTMYMATRIGFVKVFGELGLIGLVLFILLYYNIIRKENKARLSSAREVSYFAFTIMVLIMLIANSFYSGVYFKGAGNIVLLIVFGYLISVQRKRTINYSKH
jgi:hypothetical protein